MPAHAGASDADEVNLQFTANRMSARIWPVSIKES